LTTRTPPALAGVHVLVVDDDDDSRSMLRAFLSHHGALVTVAADAVEALAALHRAKVHLIVSDLSMPGIDGLELLLRVRTLPGELHAPTPAIALTAFDSVAYRRRALDAGFDGYLTKPFDSEALVRAIVRLCR